MMPCIALHETSRIFVHFLKVGYSQPWGFNRGSTWMGTSVARCFSGLIIMFFFYILQISIECIQICSGCTAPISTLLATTLLAGS
jgi:hypothetical protein